MRRVILALSVVLTVGCGGRAHAIDLETFFYPLDFTPQFRPYVAGGFSYIHHTGYDRDRTVNGERVRLEQWEYGGKAIVGVQVLQWASVEAAFHFLNSSPFGAPPTNTPGSVPGHEKSDAIAISILGYSKPFLQLGFPFKLFSRLGGAYKRISDHDGLGLIQREQGFAFLIGGGGEFELSPNWFACIEYEYLSKIGTERAVNVQHTPISFSIGARY